MIGLRSLLSRAEAAAEAFLAEPTRLQPGVVGVMRRPHYDGVSRRLTERERDHLADQALGLMDPDVRGWVIVTIREHCGGADIDCDVHIPAGTNVGVETVLSEAIA